MKRPCLHESGIGPDLMQGARAAESATIEFPSSRRRVNPVHAYMRCAVCADLRISEIVDQPNCVVSPYFCASCSSDRTRVARVDSAEFHRDFVDVAPAPVFVAFKGAHDGVPRRTKVPGRVPVHHLRAQSWPDADPSLLRLAQGHIPLRKTEGGCVCT